MENNYCNKFKTEYPLDFKCDKCAVTEMVNNVPDVMTLCDYFAGQALNGALSYSSYYGDIRETARICYAMADAMMEARKK